MWGLRLSMPGGLALSKVLDEGVAALPPMISFGTSGGGQMHLGTSAREWLLSRTAGMIRSDSETNEPAAV